MARRARLLETNKRRWVASERGRLAADEEPPERFSNLSRVGVNRKKMAALKREDEGREAIGKNVI